MLLEYLVQNRAFLVGELPLANEAVEQLRPRPPKDALNQVDQQPAGHFFKAAQDDRRMAARD